MYLKPFKNTQADHFVMGGRFLLKSRESRCKNVGNRGLYRSAASYHTLQMLRDWNVFCFVSRKLNILVVRELQIQKSLQWFF